MNKKNILLVKLLLLLCLLVLVCGIGLVAVGNFSYANPFYEHTNTLPQTTVKGDAKSFSEVEKIVLHATSLPIHIYESDVSQVTVIDNSKKYGFRIGNPNTLSQEGNTLTFEQGKQFSFFSFIRGEIIVQVPKDAVLEYDVNNISGSIVHDAPSKNELLCESISGSVRVMQGGEAVRAKSTSGSVRVYGSFEEVVANTKSGSVRVVADQDSKEMDCSSTSGSVRIQMENVSNYEMRYSTLSGSVKDEYSGATYSKSGILYKGEPHLKIDASCMSGSIRLTDWT